MVAAEDPVELRYVCEPSLSLMRDVSQIGDVRMEEVTNTATGVSGTIDSAGTVIKEGIVVSLRRLAEIETEIVRSYVARSRITSKPLGRWPATAWPSPVRLSRACSRRPKRSARASS